MVSLLISCQSISKSELLSIIPGKWCELTEKEDGCIGYMLYGANGTFEAYGRLHEYDYEYKTYGNWTSNNREICIYRENRFARKISTKELIHNGPDTESYCDKVIESNNSMIIYMDPEGKVWKMVRRS